MTTKIKERIINELRNFPEDKIESLIDYMHFLKQDSDDIKIPNKETEQTLRETDAGKNLVECKDADDMFKKLDI